MATCEQVLAILAAKNLEVDNFKGDSRLSVCPCIDAQTVTATGINQISCKYWTRDCHSVPSLKKFNPLSHCADSGPRLPTIQGYTRSCVLLERIWLSWKRSKNCRCMLSGRRDENVRSWKTTKTFTMSQHESGPTIVSDWGLREVGVSRQESLRITKDIHDEYRLRNFGNSAATRYTF